MSAVDAHRPDDVLQRLLATIEKFGFDLAPHLAERVFRNADTTRFGDSLKPCCEINTVTEDIIAVDHYVAEVDADAPFHLALAGDSLISLGYQFLECDRALHSAYHRGELDQNPVAGRLDDPPPMLGNERIGRGTMLAQHAGRTRLDRLH